MCVFVAQSCVTLCDPVDCSLPDSSVHWDSPGKNTTEGCYSLLQGIFLTGIKLRTPALKADSLPSEPPGNHEISQALRSNVRYDLAGDQKLDDVCNKDRNVTVLVLSSVSTSFSQDGNILAWVPFYVEFSRRQAQHSDSCCKMKSLGNEAHYWRACSLLLTNSL